MNKVACWRWVCTVCLWQHFKVHALCDLLITRRVHTANVVPMSVPDHAGVCHAATGDGWLSHFFPFLRSSISCPVNCRSFASALLSYLHTPSWRTCVTHLESFVDRNPPHLVRLSTFCLIRFTEISSEQKFSAQRCLVDESVDSCLALSVALRWAGDLSGLYPRIKQH